MQNSCHLMVGHPFSRPGSISDRGVFPGAANTSGPRGTALPFLARPLSTAFRTEPDPAPCNHKAAARAMAMQRRPMLLLLAVLGAAVGAAAQAAAPAASTEGPTYYIAADEVAWNYAPSGVNLCYGESFSGAWPGPGGGGRRAGCGRRRRAAVSAVPPPPPIPLSLQATPRSGRSWVWAAPTPRRSTAATPTAASRCVAGAVGLHFWAWWVGAAAHMLAHARRMLSAGAAVTVPTALRSSACCCCMVGLPGACVPAHWPASHAAQPLPTAHCVQALAEVPQQDKHVGIYGPILRASVGQVLTIVLKNNLEFAINLEPAGVQPAEGGGGAAAAVQPTANPIGQTPVAPSVAPGETITYRFLVPASMGPSELEPSAKMWL